MLCASLENSTEKSVKLEVVGGLADPLDCEIRLDNKSLLELGSLQRIDSNSTFENETCEKEQRCNRMGEVERGTLHLACYLESLTVKCSRTVCVKG